jgi:hypothetical protein
MSGPSTMGEEALALAEQGQRVFPLFEPTASGCSCAKGACSSPGKHPRTRNGLKDATSDPAQVKAWWSKAPNANIGCATGEGLVVVDMDGPNGQASAQELELPETATAATGAGRHLYYLGDDVPCRANYLPGIDIRGKGGYVVAPPSRHPSGATYRWSRDLDSIEEAPKWLTGLAEPTNRQPVRGLRALPSESPVAFDEGSRNDGLYRRAVWMRAVGLTEGEIEAALGETNVTCCKPPLDPDEVAGIASSAAGLPPAWLLDPPVFAEGLSPHDIAVYFAIASHLNPRGECFPGQQRLADMTGMCRQRVSQAVNALQRANLLEVELTDAKRNTYRFITHEQPEAA